MADADRVLAGWAYLLEAVTMERADLYTPDMAGSGQYGKCAHCNLMPTPEGHDGCLGTLDEKIVMNACCGHGNDRQAYVQFWDSTAVRGDEAVRLMEMMAWDQ